MSILYTTNNQTSCQNVSQKSMTKPFVENFVGMEKWFSDHIITLICQKMAGKYHKMSTTK